MQGKTKDADSISNLPTARKKQASPADWKGGKAFAPGQAKLIRRLVRSRLVVRSQPVEEEKVPTTRFFDVVSRKSVVRERRESEREKEKEKEKERERERER